MAVTQALSKEEQTPGQAVTRADRPARRLALPLLALLLIAVVLLAVGIGAVAINPEQVVAILLKQVGIATAIPFETRQESVLMVIRLPRVVMGVLIGATLAVSGAAIQGLFRNPLADPGLIGISSGAALAAALMIVLGTTVLSSVTALLGSFALPLAAFIGGFAATLLIYRLATLGGRTSVPTMLLAGIAINALCGAVIGMMTYVASDDQLRDITFWSLGSLGRANWSLIAALLPFTLLTLLPLPLLARSLNAMLLGETEAGHLGVNVERVKLAVIVLVALGVGADVAVAGVIGFLGLVVPHLIRLVLGPDHRLLLPASALLGASLLVGADLLARTVAVPAEVPIGIVTALVGGPFFLWLLLRDRRRTGF
ncbi:MAG TPA: iron ABC transporter permease [Phototrophicaceae bacterium]|nr:iron ABC transporter permease [Phototrophicaceae bacterium]